MRRLLVLMLALVGLSGCATLDCALYDTSKAIAPTHPVYGTPVLNVIPEDQEVAQAQQRWAQLTGEAHRQGIAVDPPGERLDRIRAVFTRLVAVSHRQHLPWEVHLAAVPDANAFTPGGGMVIVYDGLFGSLVPERDDEALGAVLAHEIAHVALLHPPVRLTWVGLGSLAVKDGRSACDPLPRGGDARTRPQVAGITGMLEVDRPRPAVGRWRGPEERAMKNTRVLVTGAAGKTGWRLKPWGATEESA